MSPPTHGFVDVTSQLLKIILNEDAQNELLTVFIACLWKIQSFMGWAVHHTPSLRGSLEEVIQCASFAPMRSILGVP